MKESSISEIFGGSEITKSEARLHYKKHFEKQDLLDKELPKTAEEILIISIVNKETNGILEKFGIEQFDIAKKNIHILKADFAEQFFEKISASKTANGSFVPKQQAIFLKEEKDPLLFMQNLVHEMCHFKSYQSLQIFPKSSEKIVTDRHAGLSIQLRNKEARNMPSGEYAFVDLNEAVIDMLANRSLKNILSSDSLPEKLRNLGEKYENQTNEVFWHSYGVSKLRFWDLVTEIYETHKNQFQSPEAIFEIFVEAMFKKKSFLSVGKLIESTFGKGSFRLIGEGGMPESDIEKSIEIEE